MANLDAMFGLPRPTRPAQASCTIMFMEMQDVEIALIAEIVPLPGFGIEATRITLKATANGQEVTAFTHGQASQDCAVLLFQLCGAPCDTFIGKTVLPFVQQLCDALGRPMIQVVKPQ